MTHFVKEPGISAPYAHVAASHSAWTQQRFTAELFQVGIANVLLGANAERWFEAVSQAVQTGGCTFDDYITVRSQCPEAKFDHRVAIEMAVSRYGT